MCRNLEQGDQHCGDKIDTAVISHDIDTRRPKHTTISWAAKDLVKGPRHDQQRTLPYMQDDSLGPKCWVVVPRLVQT